MSSPLPAFHVLSDPWIPLGDGAGHPIAPCSYLDLMTGEVDSPELVHPRDDVPFFSRMLLSALTQALFGDLAGDAGALEHQRRTPLARSLVLEHADDPSFELVRADGAGFLQTPMTAAQAADPKARINSSAQLLAEVPTDSCSMLTRQAWSRDGLCPACAVPLLYGMQAFAPQGGKSNFGLRGKARCVRGDPPTTTLLVDPRSVRESVWANVLPASERAAYGADGERPWVQESSWDEPAPLGLSEGLFWQPRALHLEWMPAGLCDGHGGTSLHRVGVFAFRSKSNARMRPFYRHPYTPIVTRERGPAYVRLDASKPAWTGLAELLPETGSPREGEAETATAATAPETETPAPRAAAAAAATRHYEGSPALAAHRRRETARGDERAMGLSVFQLEYSGGKLKSRFAHSYPVSLGIAERIRPLAAWCTDKASQALAAMRRRLYGRRGVLRTRKAQRRELSDWTSGFWLETEGFFWAAARAELAGDGARARRDFLHAVSVQTLDLFGRASALVDGSQFARSAITRNALKNDLLAIGWTPYG